MNLRWGRHLLAAIVLALATQAIAEQVLFDEQFNTGTSLDRTKWLDKGSWTYGVDGTHTQFDQNPIIGGGYARMRFDTYNPALPGTMMSGTYIQAIAPFANGQFQPPSAGQFIRFETRLRNVNSLNGLNSAFFLYGEHDSPVLSDEIDFEFATRTASNNPLVVSTYYNYGDPKEIHEWTRPNVGSSLSGNGWKTYRMDWYPDKVEFYANDMLLATHTKEVPAHPMALKMYICGTTWSLAYDSSLVPVANPASDRTCYMDVDYVTVTLIPEPVTATMIILGGLAMVRRR